MGLEIEEIERIETYPKDSLAFVKDNKNYCQECNKEIKKGFNLCWNCWKEKQNEK